jgi:hypothetical protein
MIIMIKKILFLTIFLIYQSIFCMQPSQKVLYWLNFFIATPETFKYLKSYKGENNFIDEWQPEGDPLIILTQDPGKTIVTEFEHSCRKNFLPIKIDFKKINFSTMPESLKLADLFLLECDPMSQPRMRNIVFILENINGASNEQFEKVFIFLFLMWLGHEYTNENFLNQDAPYRKFLDIENKFSQNVDENITMIQFGLYGKTGMVEKFLAGGRARRRAEAMKRRAETTVVPGAAPQQPGNVAAGPPGNGNKLTWPEFFKNYWKRILAGGLSLAGLALWLKQRRSNK